MQSLTAYRTCNSVMGVARIFAGGLHFIVASNVDDLFSRQSFYSMKKTYSINTPELNASPSYAQ